MKIEKTTLKFLSDLSKNNNREWFKENKDRYVLANENAKAMKTAIETELNKIDEIEKSKLFRIYRDVRFSKDKTPYNPDIRMSFTRAGAHRRGGYYLNMGPNQIHVAAGFWRPEPSDLKLIRGHIATDAKPLRKILKSKKFVDTFGSLQGEQLKNSPRGFDKDHPDTDLLQYKQFYVNRTLPKGLASDEKLVKEIVKTYKAVRPWFDYMTDILTHDLNGISLI
jgi:uncharacterized protein (TIGR02453 family)